MKLLATFKHISSKNADYGAAEAYLTFEHDEFTMKPTLDENGRLVPREGYRLATLNCGEEDFAVACLRSNLRYGKNQKREDVKSHQMSFLICFFHNMNKRHLHPKKSFSHPLLESFFTNKLVCNLCNFSYIIS
mgnify:CR=1 FL=1